VEGGGLAQTRNQPIGCIGAARERAVWEICTRTRQCSRNLYDDTKRATRRKEGEGGVRLEARVPLNRRIRESAMARIRRARYSRLRVGRRTPSAFPSPSPPHLPRRASLPALCSIRQALLIFPRAPGVIRARSASFALSTSVSVASPGQSGARERREEERGDTSFVHNAPVRDDDEDDDHDDDHPRRRCCIRVHRRGRRGCRRLLRRREARGEVASSHGGRSSAMHLAAGCYSLEAVR